MDSLSFVWLSSGGFFLCSILYTCFTSKQVLYVSSALEEKGFNVHRSRSFWVLFSTKVCLICVWIGRYGWYLKTWKSLPQIEPYYHIPVIRFCCWGVCLSSVVYSVIKRRTSEQFHVKLWFLVETIVPALGYLVPSGYGCSLKLESTDRFRDSAETPIAGNNITHLMEYTISNDKLTLFWKEQTFLALVLFTLSFRWIRTLKWPWEIDYASFENSASVELASGNKYPSTSPISCSNWFMRSTCSWVFPLVWRAYKTGKIEFDDLPENPDAKIQTTKYKKFQAILKEDFKRHGKGISLFRVCWKVWYADFFYMLIPLTANVGLSFLSNFMFQWTLEYIEHKEPEDSNRTFEFVLGYSLILFFSILTDLILFFELDRIKLQIRYAWTNAIYSKSLWLSQRACLEMTKGKVQNLISTDVESVLDVLEFLFCYGFEVFVKIAVACVALWHLVGIAFLPSMAIVFIAMVATFILANISRYYSKMASNVSDERIKLTTEMVKNISVVKSLGWSGTVTSWIMDIRNKEMHLVFKRMIWGLLGASINFIIPNIITFVTISLYVLAENYMSLAVVFAAGNWLNTLRNNLQRIPRLYQNIVHANVSFERVRAMLASEELQENTCANQESDSIVTFNHATLSWYSQYQLTSKNPATRQCCDSVRSRCFWNTSSTSGLSSPDVSLPLLAHRDDNMDMILDREEEMEKLSLRGDIIIPEKSESSCLSKYYCFPLEENDGPVVLKKTNVLSAAGNKDTPNNDVIVKSKLNVVIGKIGQGKSSLVNALTCGDIEISAGRIIVNAPRGIALSRQVPWLKTGTIRENILFGSEFEPKLYQDVLRVCQLQDDLKKLPKLDLTEIGEKGTKLSGGQQARVAMARAVYRRSTVDMFVFDDTFSALDAAVSNKVFHDLLSSRRGLLRDTTRILITHDQRWLKEADNVIYLNNGEIKFSGMLDELSNYKAVDEFINVMLEKDSNRLIDKNDGLDVGNVLEVEKATTEAEKDIALLNETESENDEEEKKGSVNKLVYLRYFKKMGYWVIPSAFFLLLILVAFANAQNLWLAYWMRKEKETDADNLNMKYYIFIYGIFLFGYSVVDFAIWFVLTIGGYVAGCRMHDELTKSVTRSSMDFFWKHHSGKIINRFSSDLESVQDELYYKVLWLIYATEWTASSIVPIIVLTPWSLSVVLPIWIVIYLANWVYRYAERDLQRLKKTKKSPILLFFTECLDGANTIRSYKVEKQFLQKYNDLATDRNRASYYYCAVVRFSEGNLEFIGACAIVLCIITILWEESTGELRPEFAAVLLMYALNIEEAMHWFIRSMTDLEVEMVSTERLFTYIDEKPEMASATKPNPSWPAVGKIELKDIRFKYSGSDNIALGKGRQGLSLTINPGEKFAFVGRTGSGKSTLFKAMLRFRDCFEGSILIDKVDITTVSHDILRNRMSCVTQENVLFSTTLRKNLDPDARCDDEKVWNALERVGLKDKVMTCNGKLEVEISSGEGDLFSLGERQLISLARALLRKSNILLLDEATAAVDVVADRTIQDVITRLEGITILSIAHRLSTIVGFDRVAVLSDGALIECGSPKRLLEDTKSAFYALANAH